MNKRIEKMFFRNRSTVTERPVNKERVLVGDTYITREVDGSPSEGLVYSDFSAQSLIDAGATDLLQGHPVLAGNTIAAYDAVASIEDSGALDVPETVTNNNNIETKED